MDYQDSSAAPRRIEIQLTHDADGPVVTVATRDRDILDSSGLYSILLDADDGADLCLLGIVKHGNFYATSVIEGPPGSLMVMSREDFALFCEALGLPHI